MGWDAIAGSAEVVSAIAVVVSLIYVGRQVKEGNRLARANSVHMTNSQWASMMSMLAENADLASIYPKAPQGENLDPDEFVRYSGFLFTYIAFVEDVHNQQLAGVYPIDLLSTDVAAFLEPQYRRLLKSDQSRTWFETEAGEVMAPDLHSKMLECLNAHE
jgi:hypothetical protein